MEEAPEKIKMPVKFHGNYVVSIIHGGDALRERCQKLTIRPISAQEKHDYFKDREKENLPTHQITFYDFGCKRVIEGILKINEEARVVFGVQDKDYEFSLFVPKER
ncbi:MAG: hypothetical protein K9K37_11620 [Desulfocapsa sp.]|nr:hypothetical protein [Desulfocapsa sp.]